jgi:glutamate-1-semialdehyde aminotransferase
MHHNSNSKKWRDRAEKVTPVAAQTYSKSHRYFSGNNAPYFLEKGEGATVWDVDNRQYTDFILGLGPVTIGYNNPEVNNAITEQLEKGISFSQPTPIEVITAEKIIEIIPCAEKVRFVKNGSDATSAATRLARAKTQRRHIAVCGYHGMQDWYIGSTINNKGIPKEVCDLSHGFNYNDIDSLELLFKTYPNDIAAVILEPAQEDGPKDDFLHKVQALCKTHGSALIFDEVISGFRAALGGAQELYGVTPDMASIGKGMANGMPISAVVGKADYLDLIEQGIFVSTTFGGETLSLAATLKTIEILERPDSFKHLWNLGSMMKTAMQQSVTDLNLSDTVTISGLPTHCGIFFNTTKSITHTELLSLYQSIMLNNGMLTFGVNNICMSHTEQDIKDYIKSHNEAMAAIKHAIDTDHFDASQVGTLINPIFKRN